MIKTKNHKRIRVSRQEIEKQCRYEEHCEAQLCPIDKDVDNYVFYPEEQICKNPEYSNLRWINRQRALRKHKRNTDIGFFNKSMLEVLRNVTCKTKGIDTRLENQPKAIKVWLQRCHKKSCSRVHSAVFSADHANKGKTLSAKQLSFSSIVK